MNDATAAVQHQPPRETRFRIGAGIGMVSETLLALFEPMNADLAEEIAALVASRAGIDEILELISSRGLRSLGSFTLVQYEESGIRVVVRGVGCVTVMSDGNMRTIEATGVRTWLEELVNSAECVRLTITQQPNVESPFRISSGIVPADYLSRDIGSGRRLTESDVSHLSLPLPVDQILVGTTVSAESEFDHSADVGRTMSASEFEEHLAPAATTASDVASAPANDAGNVYDALYGHTVARSVHLAAVGLPEAESVEPQPSGSWSAPTSSTMESADSPPMPLIQAVPGAAAGVLGDHDGRTISKAQLNALRDAPQVQPVAIGAPSVQALLCGAGHPNAPTAALCRLCSAPLGGAVTVVPRPILGVLDFVGGIQCRVDRPVLVGRNPKVEGTFAGELPQLVKLDVGQGLSRTHAAIRIEGWQVLLEDLNSANGTVVTLPGREPRRLHPGEPVLLEPNCHIDFGGEVACVFR